MRSVTELRSYIGEISYIMFFDYMIIVDEHGNELSREEIQPGMEVSAFSNGPVEEIKEGETLNTGNSPGANITKIVIRK